MESTKTQSFLACCLPRRWHAVFVTPIDLKLENLLRELWSNLTNKRDVWLKSLTMSALHGCKIDTLLELWGI